MAFSTYWASSTRLVKHFGEWVCSFQWLHLVAEMWMTGGYRNLHSLHPPSSLIKYSPAVSPIIGSINTEVLSKMLLSDLHSPRILGDMNLWRDAVKQSNSVLAFDLFLSLIWTNEQCQYWIIALDTEQRMGRGMWRRLMKCSASKDFLWSGPRATLLWLISDQCSLILIIWWISHKSQLSHITISHSFCSYNNLYFTYKHNNCSVSIKEWLRPKLITIL